MSTVIQMGTNAELSDVRVAGYTTDIRVEMLGDHGRLDRVRALGSEVFGIVVAGNDCHLVDIITGLGLGAACIEVTGDRAIISTVESAQSGLAAAVRFNGTTGSVISGLTSRAEEHGLVVLDSDRWTATDIYVESSDTEGVIIDGSTRGRFEGTVYNAGRHGVRVTDSGRNRLGGQVIDASRDTNNTYDGVFMDGDSDRNRTEFTVTYLGSGNQMRYGLNISASTCDNNVEASILDGSGSTGSYNNAGTGTVVTDDHLV